MLLYTEHSVNANGIAIHYYHSAPESGGKAPVVLLHGLTDNGLCWLRVAERLSQTYDIYMPDARGHGFSSKPPQGYSQEDMAADVAAFIEALGLERPIVMGHSMGGQVAMAVAGTYPDLVRAVLLEDPAWFEDKGATEEESQENNNSWQTGLLNDKALGCEGLIERCRKENPQWHEEELAPWADAKMQMDVNALVQILASIHGGWRDLVKQSKCPVLLITAEEGRGIITPAMGKEAAALWTLGREVRIAGAGHCVHRDQFEPTMAEVEKFMEEVVTA